RDSNEPVVAEPVLTEPRDSTEPVVAEPVLTEPRDSTEPVMAEPVLTEPRDSTEPVVAEPALTEPRDSTEPVVAEPVLTEPRDSNEPVVAEPALTEPHDSTEPVVAEPALTEPHDSTEPVVAEPVLTESRDSTEPVVAEPALTSPRDSTEPVVAEPALTEPRDSTETEPVVAEPPEALTERRDSTEKPPVVAERKEYLTKPRHSKENLPIVVKKLNTFEITIQRQSKENWPIVVERSCPEVMLPIRNEGYLQLTQTDFEELRSRLGQPEEYGTFLGQKVFQGGVRDAFASACGQSPEGMRVLLFIEAEDIELRTLQWERLCAPKEGQWDLLRLDQSLPFSLYIPASVDRRFPPIGKRDLRALILAASPENLGKYRLESFDVEAAVTGVRDSLGEIPCEVLALTKDAIGPPTLDELCRQLTDHSKQYTLLHFICHGKVIAEGETALYWANANNQAEVVTGDKLIRQLRRLQGPRGLPHFSFLATCESASAEAEGGLGGLAQRLVRDLGMPAVIAMTEKISVKTALVLGQRFYQQLRDTGYVDLALTEAMAGLMGRYDIAVPALFSRLAGQPLFSDSLDRPLTNAEIKYGLEQLQTLVKKRAPVLHDTFAEQINRLQNTLAVDITALSYTARHERESALLEINNLCQEISDMSFNALALGKTPPNYEDRCPFCGLYPFHGEDQEFFFGREKLTAALQQKLTIHRFLAVLGPSGSGKSSLILAGLVPQLQAEQPELKMAYLTPRHDPLDQLTTAQKKVQNQPAVFVVDQFEELFTLCTEDEQRQQFIERLLALSQQQRVVITMRADFWGECAPYESLKILMEARQTLIGPMNTAELRAAMERQAAKVGLRFEADLSNAILDDVKEEPGAMPLLQHGLQELWKRRHGRWLKTAEYRDGIGGIKLAIAKTADDVYNQLPPSEYPQFKNIFIRLTRLDESGVQGEGSRDTRRRVSIEELVPADGELSAIKALVKHLADARLVVTSRNPVTRREEVEIVHEALIRYWPRLLNWLEEERTHLQLRETIRQAALAWEDKEKNEDYLVHKGVRLERVKGLAQQAGFLNQLEADYVNACVVLAYKQMLEKDEAQRKAEKAQDAARQAQEAAEQAREEAEQAQEKAKQAQEKAEQAQKETEQAQADVKETRAKIKQAEEDIRLVNVQLADNKDAKDRITKLKNKIAKAEKAKKALKPKWADAVTKVQEAIVKAKEAADKAEEAEQEAHRQRELAKEAQEKATNAGIETLKHKNLFLEAQLRNVQTALEKFQADSRYEELQAQLKEAQKKVELLETQLKETHFKSDQEQQELNNIKQDLEAAKAHHHSLNAETQEAKKAVTRLKAKLNKAKLETIRQEVAQVKTGYVFRDTLTEGGLGPEMIWIPAGQFQMGDIDNAGTDDEQPVHDVSIQRFAIGRYAVTFEEYDCFAQAMGREKPDDEGWGRGQLPVINVSWQEAKAYTEWLSTQTGKKYCLPSEAQWEYMARAGTDTRYYWGNEPGVNKGNFNLSGSEWSGKRTAPVGSFMDNPFGVYDTVGNTWEWVADSWHDNYEGAPSDESVWGEEDEKVRRGGSWFNEPFSCRAAYRLSDSSDYRSNVIGFRVAANVDNGASAKESVQASAVKETNAPKPEEATSPSVASTP
ncbi:MAG: hypothetical protein DRR19_12465, partial [Candidatus Parabeggiatoa sp. nov. 1]